MTPPWKASSAVWTQRQAVAQLVAWGEDNHLQLNATKMKEMVVDFRCNKTLVEPLVINGETIDMGDGLVQVLGHHHAEFFFLG